MNLYTMYSAGFLFPEVSFYISAIDDTPQLIVVNKFFHLDMLIVLDQFLDSERSDILFFCPIFILLPPSKGLVSQTWHAQVVYKDKLTLLITIVYFLQFFFSVYIMSTSTSRYWLRSSTNSRLQHRYTRLTLLLNIILKI